MHKRDDFQVHKRDISQVHKRGTCPPGISKPSPFLFGKFLHITSQIPSKISVKSPKNQRIPYGPYSTSQNKSPKFYYSRTSFLTTYAKLRLTFIAIANIIIRQYIQHTIGILAILIIYIYIYIYIINIY